MFPRITLSLDKNKYSSIESRLIGRANRDDSQKQVWSPGMFGIFLVRDISFDLSTGHKICTPCWTKQSDQRLFCFCLQINASLMTFS